MNVLVPITITDAMILSGTSVSEPASSETAWASGGTYALGDRRIRSTTHRVYECVQAHTGRTALPEADAAYWLDAGPTLRYAPFDWYTTTQATATTSLTYVLQPGYFNALSLYGLTGSSITVTVKDSPGGTAIYTYSGSLSEPPVGWYEFLFATQRPISKLVLTGIPLRPTAELTITITAAPGAAVGVGVINAGDYRPLRGDGAWGGTVYGATAEPTSYSYLKTDDDGTTTIKRRPSATSLSTSDVMPRESADYALACIQEVLDVPVSWIATDARGYSGLNVFGLGSGRVSYESCGHATVTLTVKGLI